MRIILMSLLFLLNTAFANEVIITFNPLDCITCTSGIFLLSDDASVKQMKVVVKEMYREDSAELNEKYEFHKFPKLQVCYNDGLYNRLNGGVAKEIKEIDKNRLFIVSDDGRRILYTQELDKLNLTQLKRILANTGADVVVANSSPSAVMGVDGYAKQGLIPADSFCYSAINKKLNVFDVKDKSIISSDVFGKYAFFNTDSRSYSQMFRIDSAAIVFLYKSYYGRKFDERYPVMKTIMDETPSFKPVVNSINAVSTDTVVAVFQVKDYFLDEKNDTALLGHGLIMKYNVKTKKVISCYIADGAVGKDFYLWYVFYQNDKYYAQGLCGNDFCMEEVKLDEKKHTYSLSGRVLVSRPVQYNTLKVPSTEEDNIVLNDGLCAFVYDRCIYDIKHQSKTIIPFTAPSTTYNTYRLIDLQQDADNYYILYLYRSGLMAMQLSKHDNTVKEIPLGDKHAIDEYNVKFYQSGSSVIYRPTDKTCLYVSNLKY